MGDPEPLESKPMVGAGRSIASLVVFVLAVAGAASFGGMFMPGEWYAGLNRPALNPPGWVFGPVWSVLYVMIAVSGWRVWRTEGAGRLRSLGLVVFFVQLVLNALWSWIFFGLHALGWALVEIAALNLTIAAMIVIFWRVNRPAAWLLVPYWLWVSFASYLTWGYWKLN